jgi:hypothetical protein
VALHRVPRLPVGSQYLLQVPVSGPQPQPFLQSLSAVHVFPLVVVPGVVHWLPALEAT